MTRIPIIGVDNKKIIGYNVCKGKLYYLEQINQFIKRRHMMATSSFTKTFVFTREATRKIEEMQKQSGMKVSSSVKARVKEGKEALTRFSSPLKK